MLILCALTLASGSRLLSSGSGVVEGGTGVQSGTECVELNPVFIESIETEVANVAKELASDEDWIFEEQFEAHTGLIVTGGAQSDAICALEQFVVSHTSKDVWSHFFGDAKKV